MDSKQTKHYKAIVIGAGPAGITAVACLLSNNIRPILWIDPEFKVGRLKEYFNVPANTKNTYFLKYFEALEIFNEDRERFTKYWDKLDPEDTNRLLFIYDAMKEATQHLIFQEGVEKLKDTVSKIEFKDGVYHVNDQHEADYVFLCTGSEPNALEIHDPKTQTVVDFDTVMNDDYMDIDKQDRIAVFGSSHSAMLGIMNLHKYTKKITNFYRDDVKYAVYYPDWILYDNTGLKGDVAEWTKKNIDSLNRVNINDEKFKEEFAKCNKIVYCVGFHRKTLPEIIINGQKMDTTRLKYNEETGQLHERMFGFGIAFPKRSVDRLGNVEYAVGVYKFLIHAQEAIDKIAVDLGLEKIRTIETSEKQIKIEHVETHNAEVGVKTA